VDVQLTEEQEALRESAREFLRRECPNAFVREQMAETKDLGGPLWQQMAELGWLGLTVPEAYGGAGLDLLSLSIVCQEMGRTLLPLPYLSTVAIGARALVLGGNDEQKATHLPGIAEGRTRIALAQLEEGSDWRPQGIELCATTRGNALTLSGTKLFAHDAQNADLLIVPVRTSGTAENGITLYLLDARASGVSITPIEYVDQTRRVCAVGFNDVELAESCILGKPDQGWPLLERTLDYAKVALCGEMLGGSELVHEESVRYAKQREQFGKPIGTFQAIQHKCANQFIHVEGMRSAMYYAAWATENDEPDAHLSACLAKAYCGDAYDEVAGAAIQIHGGLGFTWEQDLHLYYKRAKASQFWLGDARHNRELAAQQLLD